MNPSEPSKGSRFAVTPVKSCCSATPPKGETLREEGGTGLRPVHDGLAEPVPLPRENAGAQNAHAPEPRAPFSDKPSCCGGGHPHHHDASIVPSAGAKYFCPMCPGVESDTPGDCPKCGMALERNPAAFPAGASAGEEEENHELRDMTRRFWIGAALTLPVFLAAMAHLIPGIANDHHAWVNRPASRWMQFALSTPVWLWCGWPVLRRGWNSILHRSPNMWTLILLGTGAAWLFSAAAMLAPDAFPPAMHGHGGVPVYFEAAAVIVVLVLLGQVLEIRARHRTGGAIRALLDLSPPTARRVADDGSDNEVPLAEVRPGDRLRVVPGARVPADGVVLEGASAVDESMITGESVPVGKAAGDSVTGGTLNGEGGFVLRAERTGADAVLGRIVSMVAEAQRSRAPVQRLADRVAAVFTPAVIAVAALTFVLWLWLGPEPRLAFAIVCAVAVLIIACPCALGLATPMSLMVGIGRGAREGVLIRNGGALERLEKLTVLVVDKTGTLTEGRPELTDIQPAPGFDESRLLSLTAALERGSGHPLAAAVTRAAAARSLALPEAENFSSVTGGGILGRVDGADIAVGKADFLRDRGVPDMDAWEQLAAPLQSAGKTVIFTAVDGRAAGLLAVADRVKTSTPRAIADLHALGIRLVMLTGDNALTAAAVAASLGIDRVEAGVSPDGKARHIQALRAAGETVGMAGDGVNDAPALAAADVGIAMGTGSDAAMETAGLTLVGGDLRGIANGVRLSRAVMANIRQNLVFAFLYNALGIPLAAGALYPLTGWLLSPMIAGAAMSLSSVSVITNALRLRNTKLGN